MEPGPDASYVAVVGIDITQPDYLRGRVPANKGRTYPAEVLTADEALRRHLGL